MEGMNVNSTRCDSIPLTQTLPHALSGTVGEGERQYAGRLDSDGRRMSDALGQRRGFTAANSSQDHDGGIRTLGNTALGIGEQHSDH